MNIAPSIKLLTDSTTTSVPFTGFTITQGRLSLTDMRDGILKIGSRRNRLTISAGAGSVMDGILCDAADALQEGHAFEIRLNCEQLAEATTLYAGTDIQLPFPVTPVLCTIDSSGPFLAVCLGDDCGHLDYAATFRAGVIEDGLYGLQGVALLRVLHDSGGCELAVPSGIGPIAGQVLRLSLDMVIALAGIIGDDRWPVTFRPAPHRLNKARRKAGRPEIPPMWQVAYVTRLGGRREAGPRVDHRGTHASPRPHDRRGHRRRLGSGKVVWVRSCQVGETQRHLTRGRAFYQTRIDGG